MYTCTYSRRSFDWRRQIPGERKGRGARGARGAKRKRRNERCGGV